MDSDDSCSLNQGTDLSGVVKPGLQHPLKDNGGPTETHLLLPKSPAVDHILVGDCVVITDQRGVARPQGVGCDIGAVER